MCMKRMLLMLTLLCQLTIGAAQQADFQKAVARYKRLTSRKLWLVIRMPAT